MRFRTVIMLLAAALVVTTSCDNMDDLRYSNPFHLQRSSLESDFFPSLYLSPDEDEGTVTLDWYQLGEDFEFDSYAILRTTDPAGFENVEPHAQVDRGKSFWTDSSPGKDGQTVYYRVAVFKDGEVGYATDTRFTSLEVDTDGDGIPDSEDSDPLVWSCLTDDDCDGGVCALIDPDNIVVPEQRKARCVAAESGKSTGSPCAQNGECASNVCYDALGICLAVCESPYDCPGDFTCIGTGLGPLCHAYEWSDACPDWAAGTLYANINETEVNWMCEVPTGTKSTGQTCGANEECRSNHCPEGYDYCLGSCTFNSDCPNGFACLEWYFTLDNGDKLYFDTCEQTD